MWNLRNWLKALCGKPAQLANNRLSIFGGLKGTVKVAPGVDLTEPTGELWAETEENISAATEPKP